MKIIIKVGTSTLVDKNGNLNEEYIAKLAQKLAVFRKDKKYDVILVSSGAIGTARGHLKLKIKPKTLREKQALAAIGQPLIMNAYIEAFSVHGVDVAQVLLTRDDFDDRVKYINARNTLTQLMDQGVIPIINENDTVAVEEINFGDNDMLAALVAAAVDADKLIIFTDVDGLYEGDPSRGFLLTNIEKITAEIESFAGDESSSGKGTGGMRAKVIAAKIATSSGVDTIIANSMKIDELEELVENKARCTIFAANKSHLEAKKSWIAFSKKPKGNIFVDKKAVEALTAKGKSLLAAGIVKVSGNFKRGDTVTVTDSETLTDFARGLVNYDIEEVSKVKGKKTDEMREIIDAQEDEIIHRNNLTLL